MLYVLLCALLITTSNASENNECKKKVTTTSWSFTLTETYSGKPPANPFSNSFFNSVTTRPTQVSASPLALQSPHHSNQEEIEELKKNNERLYAALKWSIEKLTAAPSNATKESHPFAFCDKCAWLAATANPPSSKTAEVTLYTNCKHLTCKACSKPTECPSCKIPSLRETFIVNSIPPSLNVQAERTLSTMLPSLEKKPH